MKCQFGRWKLVKTLLDTCRLPPLWFRVVIDPTDAYIC
jgi:hypothetical protein